ncbi:sugar transferase [Olivibacter sitiensis]|uniref:sugar transferase n=1 Tax=Olivibacter sitiensis TaxID=376470 RepID=UPI000426350F|nr:sugar transferase [Olivibacter sitiensis]
MRNKQIENIQYRNTDQSALLYNYDINAPFPGSSIHYHELAELLKVSKKQAIDFQTEFFKRSFDVLFSATALLVGAPIYLLLMAITKFTSKGPIFYKQERLGKDGKAFNIYKFRSMVVESEANGPQLASDDDPRITKWGKFMRKTRLDELPQFWNVLKGDMSVVGPRPERPHFVQMMQSKSPVYRRLLNIKPGITSVGQVCYGYAQNVDEMCERANLDLHYLKGVNFFSDINIIFRTLKVMVQGKGK